MDTNKKDNVITERKLIHETNYSIVPWWIVGGTSISQRTLLVGDFNDREIFTLSNIATHLDNIDYGSFTGGTCTPLNKLSTQFDFIVIKALDEERTLQPSRLNSKAKGIIDNSSMIVFLEPNHLHIKYLLSRPVEVLKSIFFDARSNQIKTHFSNHDISKFETISYNGEPHESFSPGTYFTNKNTFLKTEKIKKHLLNSRFSRLFFNSQIWCMTKNKPLLIESTINSLKIDRRFNWHEKDVKLLKIIFNNGKLILSLTSRPGRRPEYIIVIPMSKKVLQHRHNEKVAIEKLQCSGQTSKYFVRQIIHGKIDQLEYFAMEEFSGLTIDYPYSKLPDITRNAATVIKNMSKLNFTPGITFSESEFTDIFTTQIKLLNSKYPFHLNTIQPLAICLSEYHQLPKIDFMHGDMKLENFVIDESSFEIAGIIDLELVQFPGIPLIDLCYLIRYNYFILYGESFYDVFIRVIENRLSDDYQAFIDDYCDSLKIDESQKIMCLVYFFLHHFSTRYTFIEEEEVISEEFSSGCLLIQELIKTLPRAA